MKMSDWNKIIRKVSVKTRHSFNDEYADMCDEFRTIIRAALDWLEEEGLYEKSRNYIREDILSIDASHITEDGDLFFCHPKLAAYTFKTFEEVLKAIEEI